MEESKKQLKCTSLPENAFSEFKVSHCEEIEDCT
jgi:hypothetical protein